MEASSIIQGICRVAIGIRTQVERVQANKARCKRLSERIDNIVQALQTLKDIPHSKHFITSLHTLEGCVKDSLTFVEKFAEKGWCQRVLKARKYEGKLSELYERLNQASGDLKLGLSTHQIINREQDVRDQRIDYEDISSRQEEIYHLQQKALKEQQAVHQQLKKNNLAQAEQHDILMRQLASFRLLFEPFKNPQKSQEPPKASEEKETQETVNEDKSQAPALPSHYYIACCDLDFTNILHEGALGKIYRGHWEDMPVAIKVLDNVSSQQDQQSLLREAQILSRLKGPYFVSFYGICMEPTCYALIEEYMPKGSLFDYLPKSTWGFMKQIETALTIAQGLLCLHQQKIIHGGLTSQRILLNDQEEPKISAFRLATVSTHSIIPVPEKVLPTVWQAPERFRVKSEPTIASDIYSYGVVLWEIFTQKRPYKDIPETQFIAKLEQGVRETVPKTIMAPLRDLIWACWQNNPQARPTIPKIIESLKTMKALGLCYRKGVAFERAGKLKEAFSCYQEAADGGLPNAQTSLGVFYQQGLGGLATDLKKAHRLFFRAAEAGHVRAQLNLASQFHNGHGVPRNMERAIEWYEKASAQGDQKAKERLEKLNRNHQLNQ
jgi:tRNA A-37 threonylcarbamoyl transferase component Bud32